MITDVTDWPQRLLWAKKAFELAQGGVEVTWEVIGELVGAALGLPGPVTKVKVSQWKLGRQEPTFTEAVGLAEVLRVDPGWLICGAASKAPAPKGYTPVARSAGQPLTRRLRPARRPARRAPGEPGEAAG